MDLEIRTKTAEQSEVENKISELLTREDNEIVSCESKGCKICLKLATWPSIETMSKIQKIEGVTKVIGGI